MSLHIKHLIGLQNVPKEDIEIILKSAKKFKEHFQTSKEKLTDLSGKTIANFFFEDSTRTRTSFELAEKRLSADVLNFSSSSSSLSKGESFKDTVKNIEAMNIDMIVVRHSSAGIPYYLTKYSQSIIINAGDGAHEHPTQGLLDIYTIQEKLGRIKGLNVCIVGDIAHSRVALSNLFGLKTLGANVSFCGPSTMIPRNIEKFGAKIYNNIDKAIEENDVLNVLRIQLERDAGNNFPSIREYTNYFGITEQRIKDNNENILILHPGPINRGVELSPEVADGNNQVILDQVTNGLVVRMAILSLLSKT